MATPSILVAVAQAVVDELNAHTFRLPFTAERQYWLEFELENLSSLAVTVVPHADKAELNPPGYTRTIDVTILVVQKIADIKNPKVEADPLMDLMEEIFGYLRDDAHRSLAAYPTACLVDREYGAIFVPEHLREMAQFTAMLTLTYRINQD